MKKQIGIFSGSIVLAFLSIFVAFHSFQVQAQEDNGREAAYRDPVVGTTIITNVTPLQMAEAMGVPGAAIVSASFNGSDPLAFGIGDAPLGRYFPTQDNTFAILSTGLAASADTPNTSGSLSYALDGIDNSQFNDMAQLAIELTIPPNVNCLGFDFAFYSEEFPEFVGSSYNDTFTAEIGGTNLTIISGTNTVIAPWNFAFGAVGELISVNTAFGVVSNTLSTYDGVTPLLRATTPVTPGTTTEVVFTVQDLGDSIYDSAVFIDNLFVSSDQCQTGTGFTPTIVNITPNGGLLTYTNINGQSTTLDFPAGAVADDSLITFTPLYSPTVPLNFRPAPSENGQVIFAGHAFNVDGLLLPYKLYLPFLAKNTAVQANSGARSASSTPAIVASAQAGGGTFPLGQPVTIVIEYSDEELAERGIIDEMTLALWLYNEVLEEWEPAYFSCDPFTLPVIDPVANTYTVKVCHFTEFGLVGN